MPYDRLLKDKDANLTPSERKVFNFILANDEEAVFLNIQELSQRVKVSVATVVRLSKALGFRGFSEFQQELRLLFRTKLTTISRLQKAAHCDASEEAILVKVMQQDIENISTTLEQISRDDFKEFIKTLHAAKRIAIVGLRSAHSLAVFMAVALGFLQREVILIQPGIGDMWDRLFRLKKGDVLVGISFPRYTRETLQALSFAKERKIKTLAITDSPVSSLARQADFVLTARCKIDSFIESFTAPLSLINAVVTALSVYRREAAMNALGKLEDFWRSRRIYYEYEKENSQSMPKRR
jgi:DNA-binding MurR/RpiR family transcriptional regulator